MPNEITKNDKVNLELNAYEATLIFKLRKISHGRVIVNMMDGLPKRIIVEESIIIQPKEGIQLAFDKENNHNNIINP